MSATAPTEAGSSNLQHPTPSREDSNFSITSLQSIDENPVPTRMPIFTTTVTAGRSGHDAGWRPPTPPEGIIMVHTEVTVEEYFEDPPQSTTNLNNTNNDSDDTTAPIASTASIAASAATLPTAVAAAGPIYGDSSSHYQVSVWSAASQFARNLLQPEVHTIEGFGSLYDGFHIAGIKRKRTVMFLLAFVNLLAMTAESMVPVMIPVLAYDFDVQGLNWLIAGPAIGAAATILTAGQLYAVYPFKRIYLAFAVILMLSTLLPVFAPNMAFLFFTRVLLGIGLAGQQFGALAYLEKIDGFADNIRRDLFVTGSSTLGLMIGPILGGICAHRDKKWTTAFWMVFAFFAAAFLILLFELPGNLHTAINSEAWIFGQCTGWRQYLNCMDELGLIFSFFGILSFLVAFNLAGTGVSWTNGYLYIPLCIGLALIILLVLQQKYQILNCDSTSLFPVPYLKYFKTNVLLIITFFIAGVFYTILPWTALYQLVTRPEPSATATGFYLFFTTTGPHLLAVLVTIIYIGSGALTQYPILPSFSIWSAVSTAFGFTGAILIAMNTPAIFPGKPGMPNMAKEFALACVGFWSAVVLSMGHHLMDQCQHPTQRVRHGYPAQRHPYHNRSLILLAVYLGTACIQTLTGSIFMHVGPMDQLHLLSVAASTHSTSYDMTTTTTTTKAPNGSAPTWENALVLLCGYTFIDFRDVSASLFAASIASLRTTFGWALCAPLAAALAALLAALASLVYKFGVPGAWSAVVAPRGNAGVANPNVPREWQLEMGGAPSSVGPEGQRGVELVSVGR